VLTDESGSTLIKVTKMAMLLSLPLAYCCSGCCFFYRCVDLW